jgi:hypothetical protein
MGLWEIFVVILVFFCLFCTVAVLLGWGEAHWFCVVGFCNPLTCWMAIFLLWCMRCKSPRDPLPGNGIRNWAQLNKVLQLWREKHLFPMKTAESKDACLDRDTEWFAGLHGISEAMWLGSECFQPLPRGTHKCWGQVTQLLGAPLPRWSTSPQNLQVWPSTCWAPMARPRAGRDGKATLCLQPKHLTTQIHIGDRTGPWWEQARTPGQSLSWF